MKRVLVVSIYAFLPLVFINLLVYGAIVVAPNFEIFIKNLLAIPFWQKALWLTILSALSVLISWAITRQSPKYYIKAFLIFTSVLLVFITTIGLFRGIHLLRFLDSFDDADLIFRTRYLDEDYFKKYSSESIELIPASNGEGSVYGPSNRQYYLKYNDEIGKREIYDSKTKIKIFTMYHWTMCTEHIYWDQDTKYIFYYDAFDQDDLTKLYVSNIKTGKTLMLRGIF